MFVSLLHMCANELERVLFADADVSVGTENKRAHFSPEDEQQTSDWRSGRCHLSPRSMRRRGVVLIKHVQLAAGLWVLRESTLPPNKECVCVCVS